MTISASMHIQWQNPLSPFEVVAAHNRNKQIGKQQRTRETFMDDLGVKRKWTENKIKRKINFLSYYLNKEKIEKK